jgi:hypothetical protein
VANRAYKAVSSIVMTCCLLAAGACTSDPPAAPPPSASPTVLPTPPETSLARQQREDFEAAEASYRGFMKEQDRLGKLGGASDATRVMRKYAAGKYLAFYVSLLRNQKKRQVVYTANTKIGYVRPGSYAPDELTIEVCEDGRANKVLDKTGKQVSAGRIGVRLLYVREIGGTWKLWNGDEKGSPASCEDV